MAFVLDSPAFVDGHAIPTQYTCDGQNLSPPLAWHGAPAGTRSFVLIVEDPDAPSGTFRHWAIFDIGPDRAGLPEGVGRGRSAEPARQGVNDFGHAAYDGPCPPRGHGVHHYHFRLVALDTDRLGVPPDTTAGQAGEAARAHELAEAELVGTYQR